MHANYKTKKFPSVSNVVYKEALKSNKYNKLGDDIWFTEDKISGVANRINWNKYNFTTKQRYLAQNYLINYLGGYQDKNNRLLSRTNSLTQTIVAIERIFLYQSKYVNKEFRKWSLSEIVEMIRHFLRKGCEEKKEFDLSEFLGRGPIVNLCTHIALLSNYYLEGKISDGFAINIPISLLEHSCGQYLESYGINFAKWRLGGTLGEVPNAIAIMFLAWCIDVTESHETQMLLAWFKYARSTDVDIKQSSSLHRYLNRSGQSLFSDYAKTGIRKNNVANKIYENFNSLITSLEEIQKKPLKMFPWGSQDQIAKSSRKVYSACLGILFLLTGARISEIHTIKTSWLKKDSNGNWHFKSGIVKTNFGLGTVRDLSGLNATAFNILSELSYVDKEDRPDHQLVYQGYFFNKTISTSKRKIANISTVRNCLKDGWNDFLESLPADTSKEVQNQLGNKAPSPHMFRHSWAGFALRRFDFDVLEKIRHHFRHHFGSYYTRHYVNGKLTAVQQRSMEREYLNEIFDRVSTSGYGGFVGPIAVELKKIIYERVNVVGIEELEKIETDLEAFADDVSRIISHEWGLCVLKKSTSAQSQCFDKKSKIALIEESSSFDNCSKCIHRLSNTSNKEDVIRIGLSHSEFLNSYPLHLKKLRSESEKVIKNAERIVLEMSEG